MSLWRRFWSTLLDVDLDTPIDHDVPPSLMSWRKRFWLKLLGNLGPQADHYTPENIVVTVDYPTTAPKAMPVEVGDKIRGKDVRGREAIMVVDSIDALGICAGCVDGRVRRVHRTMIDRIYNESDDAGSTETTWSERESSGIGERPTVRTRAARKIES